MRQMYSSLTVLLILAGCDSLSSTISLNSAGSVPTYKTIAKCEVRQGFDGEPRQLTTDELRPLALSLGQYEKWDLQGFTYERYRVGETFVCACRDYPFKDAEVVQLRDSLRSALRNGKAVRDVKEFEVENMGPAIEFIYDALSTEASEKIRIIQPRHTPSCLSMQATKVSATALESMKFFTRLAIAGKEPLLLPSQNISNTSERLRTLEQLHKERLITDEEYSQKRGAILSQL